MDLLGFILLNSGSFAPKF